MNKSLLQLDEKFKSASSLESLNNILENYILEFNIRLFAFTYYSYYPNSLNKIKYDFCSKSLLPWHRHFIDEKYDDIDTTLDVIYRSCLPILWDTVTQLKQAKSERERRMREDSIKFGVEKGVSIPIHGPFEDFAILTLSQKKGEHGLDNWVNIQGNLFTAAYYYYQHLQKFMLKEIKPLGVENLNQRELQCLQLIAKEHSTEAIAKTLKITERTVNFHIQRLNKKLGVKNKYQAVIKAMLKGFITL